MTDEDLKALKGFLTQWTQEIAGTTGRLQEALTAFHEEVAQVTEKLSVNITDWAQRHKDVDTGETGAEVASIAARVLGMDDGFDTLKLGYAPHTVTMADLRKLAASALGQVS